jgi:hypothetical protein
MLGSPLVWISFVNTKRPLPAELTRRAVRSELDSALDSIAKPNLLSLQFYCHLFPLMLGFALSSEYFRFPE